MLLKGQLEMRIFFTLDDWHKMDTVKMLCLKSLLSQLVCHIFILILLFVMKIFNHLIAVQILILVYFYKLTFFMLSVTLQYQRSLMIKTKLLIVAYLMLSISPVWFGDMYISAVLQQSYKQREVIMFPVLHSKQVVGVT